MMRETAASQIFVGAPIAESSERAFLGAMLRLLEDRQAPFVILANVIVGGRQIDFVVATEASVSIIEVKSSRLPVSGTVNGTWVRHLASGNRREYGNPYRQALDARHIVRDAMSDVRPAGTFYPDGFVVFTTGFAQGSQVTDGDFRVKVMTLDAFLSSYDAHRASPWSLDDWHTLATRLRLTPMSAKQALLSAEQLELANLLRDYNAAVAAEYGPDAASWLPESSDWHDALVTAATAGTGCYISGPSGCGKTLAIKRLTADLASDGCPVFLFAAKDFAGSWAKALRRETGLLTDQSPSALLRAVSQTERARFVILDGINELQPSGKGAIRGILALARRLDAKLVVTGQGPTPPELNGLATVLVERPSLDLKRRIAERAGTPLTPIAQQVLAAVGSGLEAEIVGQIGQELKAGATRVALLDQYIRARFGAGGRAAYYGLRQLAAVLYQQLAFSLTETTFDDFMRARGVSFGDCERLLGVGLLIRRAGRISFSHEMIQASCAASVIAQDGVTDPVTLATRLATPVLHGLAHDILSSIDDAVTCGAVLGAITDSNLLTAAADGDLGATAKAVADDLLDRTARACSDEIRAVQLEFLDSAEEPKVGWREITRRNWAKPEVAQLRAIGNRALTNAGRDLFLRLCAEMDQVLMAERHRLIGEARQRNISVWSHGFALAYYAFGAPIGFTQIALATRSVRAEPPREGILAEPNLAALSSGQLHFFLENRWRFLDHGSTERFGEALAILFRERFRREPYHVKLALLHAVGFVRDAPDETVTRLVEAIQAIEVGSENWAISTAKIEALGVLGALFDDAENARPQIRLEVMSMLHTDDGEAADSAALSLFDRAFDHPFGQVYWEEFCELEVTSQRRLYRRALTAPEAKNSLCASWLAARVASFEDPADAPVFQKLAILPADSDRSRPGIPI